MNRRASNDRKVTVTLKLRASALRRLQRALNDASALSAAGVEAGEALALLTAEARVWEAFAAEAARGVSGLPGKRVHTIVHRALAGGESPLELDGLLNALREQNLTQRELWAVPQALRVAISENLCQTARAMESASSARASHCPVSPQSISARS